MLLLKIGNSKLCSFFFQYPDSHFKTPGTSIVKIIQFELRIDISQRKFPETFRTVEIHLRKSSREIFRAKRFRSEISLTFFSLEIGLYTMVCCGFLLLLVPTRSINNPMTCASHFCYSHRELQLSFFKSTDNNVYAVAMFGK